MRVAQVAVYDFLHSVTDFHPLATWVGIIPRLTLQRYKIVPWDVKRPPVLVEI